MATLVGLDIGSHSIKLIEIAKANNQFTLLSAGSCLMPPKTVAGSKLSENELLAEALKKLFKDTGAGGREVNIALPEAQVITRVIEIPELSSRELAGAIKWEAEQYIPLPLDQVNLDYTVLRDSRETKTNKMEVLLVAAPKVLLDRYLSILELAELTAVSAETEIIAACRALIRTATAVKTVLIVSLGATTTDLAILHGGILAFTRSIAAGGEALSRSVAQGLDFNLTQAEEFKKTYGLERDKLEGKIVAAAKPIMDNIVGEIKRAIAFYQDKYKDEQVQTVILNGGTARLPGMVVYMAETLGVETQLANPWVGLKKEARFQVLENEGPTFGVAVGLALR